MIIKALGAECLFVVKEYSVARGKPADLGNERRMVDLGRVPVTSDLLELRTACIATTNACAAAVWPKSILDKLPAKGELEQSMVLSQTEGGCSLNSVWRGKCRINAVNAVVEQHKRAVRTLFGKFRHIASVGDAPLKDGTRRLLNFPEEWSGKLSDADVAALATLASSTNTADTLALFRKVRLGKASGLPELHAQALAAMLDMVEERFGCPEWTGDDATVQLHLDYRCFPGGRKTMDGLLAAMTAAVPVDKNRAGTTMPVLIAGVAARGAPLMFRAVVLPDVVKRLFKSAEQPVRFTSLVLEIAEKQAVIKGVVTQRPAPYSIGDATHILADDFGYANTSAMAVFKLEKPLDPGFFANCQDWTKAQAKEYLSTHAHDAEPVHVELHNGDDFMAAINRHAEKVDAYRSEIALIYNRFFRIKHEVCRILNVPEDTRLDFGMSTEGNKRLSQLLAKLVMLLKQRARLKALSRAAYRAVAGIKLAWFGWLSTRKAELAKTYHAVVVREDLSIVAKEKGKPGYFGRTFNKMTNNGSKGQYLRGASAKLRWNGIPEATIPSYYTSTTDVRFATVDKKQRKTQDQFEAKTDGRVWQADLHAACVIGLYPLLRPLSTAMGCSLSV